MDSVSGNDALMMLSVEQIDYTEQIEAIGESINKLIYMQEYIYSLLLFVLSCVVGVFVCYLLFKAIKKFI